MRLHSEDKKKVRRFSEVSNSYADAEARRRSKAIKDEATRNSLEYKLNDARNKCIQPLHGLEKEWKLACKEKNSAKIEEARLKFLRGMDKAAADYIGRIMAEIKQTYLGKKGLYKDQLLQVNLSVSDFYVGFKKLCKRELKGFSITENEFNKILSWQYKRNLTSFENYEKALGYDKVVKQFNKNLECLKDIAIIENELSL